MAIQLTCPGCSKRLAVPETAANQRIKCPNCSQVFSAADAVSKPAPAPSTSSYAPPPLPSSQMWRVQTADGQQYGPVTKTELDSWAAEGRIKSDCQLYREGDTQWQSAPRVYPTLATSPSRSSHSVNPYASPTSSSSSGYQPRFDRYSTAPHRGGLILVLGILGFFVCGFLGIAAWVMGSSDLREMRAGRMDRSGEGMTQAGMIMGIIVSVLMGLGLLMYAVLIVVAITQQHR